MKPRRFVTLDVFTDRRFAGNPLAIVLDAEGLDDAAMLDVAREFNLSETVFLLPPRDPVNLARLRIFTPAYEMPFAGHPTIGTAIWLGRENGAGFRDDLNFTLEEEIGLVPCTVRRMTEEVGRARFDIPRLPQPAGDVATVEAIASALALSPTDVGFDNHVPKEFAVGPAYTFVPLNTLDALSRATIQAGHWEAGLGSALGHAFLYARGGTAADAAFQARMFPGVGLGEDPATGSAVAAFAGVLMRFQPPADGQHTLVVEQGFAMGRPSRIVLGLDVWQGRLEGATIGGEAVVVSQGEIVA